METAIRLALENNERAKKVPLRVEVAEGQLERARSAFLPTLTAGGTTQIKLQEDQTNRRTSTNGTITLSQPILNPSAFPQYAQQKHSREAEKWGSVQDRRTLAFDTARAYLLALTQERVLDAAKRRLERARANLTDTEARAAAGLTSTNDATRSQIELATAAQQVAQNEGRVQNAYLNLGFLVGRRVDPPLTPPDRTTNAAQNFDSNPDQQVRAALDRRPDLRSTHERTESLNASAREPLYRMAPTLSANAQVRLVPDPLPSQVSHDETVTLSLSWQIFDSGLRYADRRTRLAQAQSQALDESLLRRSIDNDIRVALTTLRASRESFRIAGESLNAATRSQEETNILYRQGLAKAIELTDATQQRFDSEVTLASARLTMQQAYLELRFALGFGPIDEGDAQTTAAPPNGASAPTATQAPSASPSDTPAPAERPTP